MLTLVEWRSLFELEKKDGKQKSAVRMLLFNPVKQVFALFSCETQYPKHISFFILSQRLLNICHLQPHITDNKRFVSVLAALLWLPLVEIQDPKSQNRQRSASSVWAFPTVALCHRSTDNVMLCACGMLPGYTLKGHGCRLIDLPQSIHTSSSTGDHLRRKEEISVHW